MVVDIHTSIPTLINSVTSVISENCGASTTDQRAHAVSMSMFLELLEGCHGLVIKREKNITYSGLARAKQKL